MEATFFRDLAYVFGAAVVGGGVARALRQPLILGYVLGGFLIDTTGVSYGAHGAGHPVKAILAPQRTVFSGKPKEIGVPPDILKFLMFSFYNFTLQLRQSHF